MTILTKEKRKRVTLKPVQPLVIKVSNEGKVIIREKQKK